MCILKILKILMFTNSYHIHLYLIYIKK
ncbi:hypothetical protein PFDG_01086 [Plasmodium falciparum Dd2]|uniref:Uncharacterized protein n=1 Tax=Plasmodium falciparum (isolate Dd2) TaxID=57267 RepID=A0A0L7LYA5_PLAF4|nr:hypothetical protein PFDG_01086 [Plasmodium falciparum Dd2]